MPKLERISIAALFAAVLFPSGVRADDVSLSGSVSTDDASAGSSGPYGVEPGIWELGLYGGLFIPDNKHELFDADSADVTFQEFKSLTLEVGLRAGFYPVRMFGLEIEGSLMPAQTETSGDSAILYAARGHLVLLAPTKTVVPFLVAGGGLLGISSDDTVLGSDTDGALHAGLGLKAFVSRAVALRLDGRGNFTMGHGIEEDALHWEALLGLSLVLGREAPPPAPSDRDGDGIEDSADKCPNESGPPPDGCPPPPDSDGDGILDAEDKCPKEAGERSSDPEKNGCPPPPPDRDGDGVADAIDHCPNEAGDGPDGCPLDNDGDGILNRDDKCVDQSETKNGFEDSDGCPDELPKEVAAFTGTIEGIVFATNKATIRKVSYKTLDAAAKVLSDYPELRVEISGHTDDRGTPERNSELSLERAEAVRGYLVSKGVAADRITTRGAGPSEPVDDNKTKAGRAKNRRIEFKLLQE